MKADFPPAVIKTTNRKGSILRYLWIKHIQLVKMSYLYVLVSNSVNESLDPWLGVI